MAMSTADSSLHAVSVMFANDFVKPLTGQKESSVAHARAFSVAAGFSALFMALYGQDLLSLVLLSVAFYKPIFVIPFLMAVLSFRTSARAVLLSMVAGALTVVFYKTFLPDANAVVAGMIANFLVLLGSHYLLGEPGGWLKIDPNSPLGLERAARRETWKKRKEALKDFKLYPHLEQFLPSLEGYYTLFGVYALVATFIGLFTIERAEADAYDSLYTAIYNTALWVPSVFLHYLSCSEPYCMTRWRIRRCNWSR